MPYRGNPVVGSNPTLSAHLPGPLVFEIGLEPREQMLSVRPFHSPATACSTSGPWFQFATAVARSHLSTSRTRRLLPRPAARASLEDKRRAEAPPNLRPTLYHLRV